VTTLEKALITALSVELHKDADPDCTGQPPYDVTQAQAESLVERIMRSPIVHNAIEKPESSMTTTQAPEPRTEAGLLNELEEMQLDAIRYRNQQAYIDVGPQRLASFDVAWLLERFDRIAEAATAEQERADRLAAALRSIRDASPKEPK
jgi:hypothetical protein